MGEGHAGFPQATPPACTQLTEPFAFNLDREGSPLQLEQNSTFLAHSNLGLC